MHSIAIITARGGSKRIPGKNIKGFLGKPIIAYSIETALKSGLFEDVLVSTDNEDIAAIAVQYGASVPFMRSRANSDDYTGTADVLKEVLQQLKSIGRQYRYACCIYPTAPFITIATLQNGYNLLTGHGCDTVFPVCAFSYPILRSLVMDEAGSIKMNWPENLNKRSQDLPAFYHDAGQFYWLDTAAFEVNGKLMTERSKGIILDELQVQDIDNETDWALAELKYKLINRQ